MIFNVGAGGDSKAEQVKYDNSKSGLEATELQGAVDELQGSVSELNDSLEWKLVGSATGTTAINLPSQFEELIVFVTVGTTNYNYSIPRLFLDETNKLFSHGYGINVNNVIYLGQVRIQASINNVSLKDARYSSGARRVGHD